jgi:hypothetical protein
MANKKNKANNTIAPATDANASAEAEYLKAVEKGKAITANINGKQWALGDLAAQVGKVYGENRLAKFAEDINFGGADCTLARYAVVCRAFPNKRGRPRFFASAQALAPLPARFKIVERNPNISAGEARSLRKLWSAEQTGTDAEQPEDEDLIEPEEDTEPTPEATSTPAKAAKAKQPKKTDSEEQATRENRRWFNNVVDLANQAIAEAGVIENTTPEEGRRLVPAIEPRLVKTVEQGSEALAAIAAWARKLLAEATDEAITEGRVKTSPKRAASPRQVIP